LRASIIDCLEGRFGGGPDLGSVPASDHTVQSIVSNLQRLFNTRRGSVAHLPDYGLPDMTTVYLDAPDSIDLLRRAVQEAASRYEPRLRRVHVETSDINLVKMRTTFILSGETRGGGRIRLETTFLSQDLAQVRNL
jgi:type VI secretion system protein